MDDWTYAAFDNGYVEAFSNGRLPNGTSIGASPFGGGGYAPPGFFGGGNPTNTQLTRAF